ncbi:MAG: chromosomal replication initiator protein DnaA [Candidatus Thermoplasmatota archaeon]|nr:chromosomal replication initiator protein DnaA [Candidatus Thermoplasmatota archaeon]
MGLFDWFKKGRKGKKKGNTVPDVPEKAHTAGSSAIGKYDELLRELERERQLNLDQERKIREMENRFSRMQEDFAGMAERQQITMEKMMSKDLSSTGKLGHPGPSGKGDTRLDIIPAMSNPVLEDKTFENFVVDEANRFPFLAAEAVATGIGRKYNPLFIYGDVGVGKTHILHAIANKVREMDPRKTLLYSSTEKFTDELLKALERDDLDGFRSRYRNIDVLLVDDIQMLSGKEATQTEFFHMFNHLYNSGKQIVLCSDRPPSEIKELEGRLRSRFEGGLIIDMKVPTFEGRRQILVNHAHSEGYALSPEVLDYLAFYLDSSVRELEGGFNRVTAYATLMKEPVTVSLVRKVLEGALSKGGSMKDMQEVLEEDGPSKGRVTSPHLSRNPYSERDTELEEETDKLEQELFLELNKLQK